MADFVFNIALGKPRWYFEQAGVGNAALILIPIEATGLEADATLRDYDDVASLLAGSSNPQTTMGRKTITAATVTVDDVNNRVDVGVAAQTWTAATGNPCGKLIIAYDPDTTTGTDSSLVPVVALDFAVIPDGSDYLWQPNAAGVFRCQ